MSRLLDTWTYPVTSERYLRTVGSAESADTSSTDDTRPDGDEATADNALARTVTNAEGISFDVPEGANILEAAEAAGLSPAYGCRQGRCRKRVVPLRRGRVVDVRHGLSSGTGSTIQICVTTPATDAEIDL